MGRKRETPGLTPEADLIQELARKLSWAVSSSLKVSVGAPRTRLRVWAWRLATKMVAAKKQFTPTLTPPPPADTLGGRAEGSPRLSMRESRRPTLKPEMIDGTTVAPGGQLGLALRREDSAASGGIHSAPTGAGRSGRCWCRARGLWRAAGHQFFERGRGTWWRFATPASSPGADQRRLEDCPYYRQCNLEESCRKLHPAANPEVTA